MLTNKEQLYKAFDNRSSIENLKPKTSRGVRLKHERFNTQTKCRCASIRRGIYFLPSVPSRTFRAPNKLSVDEDRLWHFNDFSNLFYEAAAHVRHNDVTSVNETQRSSRSLVHHKVLGVSQTLTQFICVTQALVHVCSYIENVKK